MATTPGSVNEPPLSYTQRLWQMQDGLPEQVVQAFAQNVDRYLWIATTGGLVRFDGERFQTFNRENTPAFSEDNVFCLTVARDHTMWIGMEGGGLIRYRGGAFQRFSTPEGLTSGFVRAIREDNNGQIWVGTDAGLFRLIGERLQRVDDTPGIPSLAVHAIQEDRHGQLWVGGSKLLRVNGDSAKEYVLAGEASQNRVKSIVETGDGTLWIGTVSGLQRMAPGDPAFKPVPQVQGTVRVLRETSDRTLWIGTIGRGLLTYRDGHFARIAAPEPLPSNTVLNLYEDIEGNIWIGTQGGMVRLIRTPVRTVLLPDASDSDAETIYQDTNGDLWVAAVNLFRVHNGKAEAYSFPGISGVRVRNVFRDREAALWIGTEGRGAYRLVGERLTHYSTREGLVNNFVRAFLQGRDGSVWIATDEGVSRWRAQRITNYRVSDGLAYFSTRSLLEDRRGDLWIGTDEGLSRLHQDSFEHDGATKALKNEKIWAIHEDSDGGLWFGTRTGGLYRWRSGVLTHYTTAQGLASNGIYELLEDDKKNLWISGPNGISAVSREELDAIAEHPTRPVALNLYGVSDGLETIQMCGGEKPAGVLTSQGEVWFPSSKGPVRVSIGPPLPPKPAPVVIDQVIADGLQIPASPTVFLGPDNAKLEIHYGVVLLRSQERIRFRYMLENFDKNWSEAAPSRVAFYTNVPPGRYHFRVVAFQMSNPELVASSSLEIVQAPHFYRTSWFLACVVVLLAACVWGSYQLRVRQIRVRFRAVLSERNRLAREMHDTLIQGCASVSALLEAHSSMEQSNSGYHTDLLDCARTQLRSTLEEAREAVWGLRSISDTSTDIGEMLKKIAEQFIREFGVTVDCSISGEPFALSQSAVHETVMIAREGLYNAIRHAQPSRIELRVNFEPDRCTLKIVDDGSGFDVRVLTQAPERHYGLLGMRERVERVHGRFILDSTIGKGTEITVEIPRRAVASAASEITI
ncbi:MAG TPA: two-component regulator propeller domain-containing protein [Candidatus Polarisedimenticolia bacterium]|nr:two-component regulator propeller domain-containing protein [Candidatus Polarisedimenticolia bacterium]